MRLKMPPKGAAEAPKSIPRGKSELPFALLSPEDGPRNCQQAPKRLPEATKTLQEDQDPAAPTKFGDFLRGLLAGGAGGEITRCCGIFPERARAHGSLLVGKPVPGALLGVGRRSFPLINNKERVGRRIFF